jgi:predicted Rossmann-fold nucleotide-binding protein
MPAMTTVVPAAPAAPVLAGIEMRPLSEDRIRRVAPVYKDGSIPPPAPVPPQPDNGNVVYDDLMGALEATIPPGVRICVLGGTAFKDDASQPLVEALAAEFSARLADSCVLLTGGMSGVQETFAKGCAAGPPVVNMLPKGQASNFGVGVDFAEFADLDERIAVFGQVGDIYISVEGGPGVAKEARAAYARNAVVLPMISTGGASGGKFDFPPEALEQPAFATQEQWDCVKTKGSPEVTAQVVVDIISAIIATSAQ